MPSAIPKGSCCLIFHFRDFTSNECTDYADSPAPCLAWHISANTDFRPRSAAGLSNSTTTPLSSTATLSNLSMKRSRCTTARTVWGRKSLSMTSCITDSVTSSTLGPRLVETVASAGLNVVDLPACGLVKDQYLTLPNHRSCHTQ
jgi:hypothetical protein